MADGNLGSVLIAINSGTAASQRGYGPMFIESLKGKDRPAIMAFPAPELDADFEASVRANRLILSRSIERSMTALSRITRHGRSLQRSARSVTHTPFADLPALGRGPQPEWLGKQLLSAMGIRVPAGGLATSLEEAEATAARVGYPLAIKAQVGALAHKTEAGGVILGISDADDLRSAKLLKGFRGSPPVDVQAVAHTASLIGRLMETVPQIEEIDLNPVFVHPQGEGLTAVDALVITAAEGN